VLPEDGPVRSKHVARHRIHFNNILTESLVSSEIKIMLHYRRKEKHEWYFNLKYNIRMDTREPASSLAPWQSHTQSAPWPLETPTGEGCQNMDLATSISTEKELQFSW
jgi:hypothetical protein